MAITVNNIYEFLDENYPFETQMSFDNAGFLVGDGGQEVEHILVALDVSSAVIAEAAKKHCQLIFTHHPLIFNPLKTLVTHKPTEKMVIDLIRHNIALISAHTNLDVAQDGVNYHLAKSLQLQDIAFLSPQGTDRYGRDYGLGYYGTAHRKGDTLPAYAQFIQTQLNCKGIRFTDAGTPVSKVAVGGGSCGSMLGDVAKVGCDTFITGDVKYDVFLEAKERGINLIDAGHYPTEQVICQPVATKLQQRFPTLSVSLSQVHQEVCCGM